MPATGWRSPALASTANGARRWRSRAPSRTRRSPAAPTCCDGSYEFAGRRFDLERGALRFQGEAPPDPVLDIVAQTNIQGLNATIRVSGRGCAPDRFRERARAAGGRALVAAAVRIVDHQPVGARGAPARRRVASLREGGAGGGVNLNPINAIRRAPGSIGLRILPADVVTGQGTSVAAGKYIGRRTYVEVITDGQGYSATRLEFQLTRWLALLSTISTIGRQSANVRVSKDY
jgi:translocation and assembly module TamB